MVYTRECAFEHMTLKQLRQWYHFCFAGVHDLTLTVIYFLQRSQKEGSYTPIVSKGDRPQNVIMLLECEIMLHRL